MFVLKPKVIPHAYASYQDFVLAQLRNHYDGGILVIVNKDWPLIAKLWRIDLSPITSLLCDLYGAKGPIPRDPTSMMRSFLLFLMTHPEIGITEWINEMKRVTLYAILAPTATPGRVKRLVEWMMRHCNHLEFTPSLITTQVGTALGRSISMATIST